MMKNFNYCFFSISIFIFVFINQNIQTQVSYDGKAAHQVYATISSGSIVTFSKDNLIRSGLEVADLKKWNDTLEHYLKFVNKDIKSGVTPKVYQSYIQKLKKINTYVQQKVNILHTQYQDIYKKEGGKYIVNIDKASKINKEELKPIASQVSVYLSTIQEIFKFTFSTMLNNTTVPKIWSKKLENQGGKLKGIKEIMPDFKKFFDQYEKNVKNGSFTDFLKEQKITTERGAESIANQMEAIRYILENNGNQKKGRSSMIKQATDIIRRLQITYPQMLTSLEVAKMNSTEDRASTTLFAFADVLHGVLNAINREIGNLLDAATIPS